MADVKISELPALTSPDGAEELVVNDGGTTKKITIANATSAALPKAGGTMTGDTLHGDNVKAKFGTGGDLEIYHDGSHSRIKDVGTGNLSISASARIGLDASNGDNMGAFNEAGSVQLFHNGSQKLATTATGIDVTGRAVTDGLTSSDSILFNNGNSSVGIHSDGANGSYVAYGSGEWLRFLHSNGGGETMRLTSTGNVGIGTSTPDDVLTIDVNEGSNNVRAIHLVGGPDVTNKYISIGRTHTTSNDHINSEIRFGSETGGNGTSFIALATGNNSSIERMRIDNSGNVLVGTTDNSVYNNATGTGTAINASGEVQIAGTGQPLYLNRQGSNGGIVDIRRDGGAVGSIYVTTTSTAYNTSSDYRLKTDVQPMTGATATFKQLKPVNFEWIADGTRVDGFLAHELQEVIPAAATGSKDAMRDEEYEVTPATGDIYTAGSTRVDAVYETVITVHASDAVDAVMSERNVTETIETGSYINLAGETIVETTEQVVTTEVTVTEVQRHDIDGVSTEVEVEVTRQVPITESYEVTPAIAETVEVTEQQLVSEAIAEVLEVIHSAGVEQPETLEEGQQWRETTAQVMATRSVPDMQGIDQAKVVPLLVATLQEALARIEALEA